jgi:hypothetical protein
MYIHTVPTGGIIVPRRPGKVERWAGERDPGAPGESDRGGISTTWVGTLQEIRYDINGNDNNHIITSTTTTLPLYIHWMLSSVSPISALNKISY